MTQIVERLTLTAQGQLPDGTLLDRVLPGEEVEAATDAVLGALAHPLLKRAADATRCHRETPLVLRLEDDQVLEGTLDLAFFDDGAWTVVDFKTDRDLGVFEEQYRRQVAWYVHTLERLTGESARGVLLQI